MRSLSPAGFTLFEAILVVALLAIVGLITYPAVVKMNEQAQFESSSREVVLLLKYAREKAMSEQESVVVAVRGAKRIQMVSSGGVSRDYPVVPSDETEVDVFKANGQVLKRLKLGTKLRVEKMVLEDQEEDGEPFVRFYPDGRCTGVAMVLSDEVGRQVRLRSDILTGNTRLIKPGDKGYDDDLYQH